MIISIDHVWDKVTCKCNGQRLETKRIELENAFINDMPTIEENYTVYTFTTIIVHKRFLYEVGVQLSFVEVQ